ncbi:MAG: polysaccharide deacetylase family protein, partial [Pirellulales bacterium]|nr:polysaccharide deacetylase family protein [Pirellulales bacterium]
THTHTHRDFREQPSLFENDLRQSLAMLEAELGVRQATFAFPYGKRRAGFSSDSLVAAARRLGVLCALTSENERTRLSDSPFTWSRLTANQADTARTLAAKLDGRYDALRSLWRRATRNR